MIIEIATTVCSVLLAILFIFSVVPFVAMCIKDPDILLRLFERKKPND
ncbi:hypothetical protein [Hyphomicrobium sp. ghe19]|nr:hypothetical protein HYPP_01965 [Hyphomicrobium sp. ghe19]